MPRQRGGGSSAPRRPTAAPAAPPRPAPQQTRPSSTAAHPPAQQQAPPAQGSQGPGLFGQMASTAAGVAVGSSIGHAVGGWFGGGSSAPAEQASQVPADNTYNSTGMQSSQYQAQGACANDVNQFRKCMDDNQGSLTICGWYLDQLKACQAAAGQY
ncbi:Mitochondrial intermembrane space cysteine motif-containing protein MIX17 [Elsinoe australis]|uniref:Mitochondrial intermembrane space cysteine motif-containing protein MIX17 n=1 Tax=Elsinoe australis TaxID=40998 RepID=A0A2P7YG33_9PEZI|nr:Mitochondrial intermembrane space cysteine motif-containing protein MIX17 [Elsinoe australis]